MEHGQNPYKLPQKVKKNLLGEVYYRIRVGILIVQNSDISNSVQGNSHRNL